MFNLIKMDLYLLLRSASTYVMIVLAAVLAVFSVYMTNLELNIEKENQSYEEAESMNTNSDKYVFGIFVETNPQWISENIDCVEMLGAHLRSRILLILVSVFVTLFVTAERKNGFIKNIAGQFLNRSTMVAAKLVVVAVQIFILFATFVLFASISSFVLWRNRVVLNSISDFLQLAGIQYLLHLSFACLIAFLCFLTGSSAFSMTIGILLCSGCATLAYGLIDRVIGKFFRIAKYTLETNISSAGAGIPSDDIRAIFVGIGFILASAILSILIVQNRDVK